MKLVWSPETASRAFIDTVQACELHQESGVAELISAMAGGWNAKLIVETWQRGGVITTSIGLAIATRHTGGRHVCIVPDNDTRSEYLRSCAQAGLSPEVVVVVGDADAEEEALSSDPSLDGIDFMVVDCRRRDSTRVLRTARLSQRGAVLVRKNVAAKAASVFPWRTVLAGGGYRVVRTAFLPVGNGLDMAHVGAATAATEDPPSSPGGRSRRRNTRRRSRWLKHVDQSSGEEHVIRT